MDDAARGVGVDPPEGAAFGWVPSGADEAMHFVRPRTAELPVRKETSAALELFDDPELELESPESRVSRGSAGTTRRRPASARGPDTSRSTANSRGRRAGC